MRNEETQRHINVTGSLSGELVSINGDGLQHRRPILEPGVRTPMAAHLTVSGQLSSAISSLANTEAAANKQLGTLEEHKRRVSGMLSPLEVPAGTSGSHVSMIREEQSTPGLISFNDLGGGQTNSEQQSIIVAPEQLAQLSRAHEDIQPICGNLGRQDSTTKKLEDGGRLNEDIERWFKRWHRELPSKPLEEE